MPDSRAWGCTLGYFGGHVVLGLVSASLGAALPALALALGHAPAQLGVAFTARGLGYLLGSLGSGRLYDRRPAHPLIAGAIVLLALGTIAVPFMPTRATLLGLMLGIGAAQGLLDVGNNTTLVRVHGERVAPFMNALHCCYGVGALLAPLVVEAAGALQLAFVVLGLALLPFALLVIVQASPAAPARGGAAPDERGRPDALERPDARALAAFVLLFVFCQALEAGFSSWLVVMARDAGFDEAAAATLLSGFWTVFTIGRVLAIGLATRVAPQRLLALDLAAAFVCVGLLALPGTLPLASLGLGLALASVFPVALTLAGRYLPLHGSVTSRIFVGASVGTMAMPWLLGHALALGPLAPLALLLGDLALALAVLLAIRFMDPRRRP
jgi:FHS family Na+ dependent glucose MFS transporter 1